MIKAGFTLGGTGNLGNGVIDSGSTKVYMKGGKKHRLNGPAEIHTNGYEAWFFNGLLHRDGDKPAVTQPNGDTEYWVKGNLIRKTLKKK